VSEAHRPLISDDTPIPLVYPSQVCLSWSSHEAGLPPEDLTDRHNSKARRAKQWHYNHGTKSHGCGGKWRMSWATCMGGTANCIIWITLFQASVETKNSDRNTEEFHGLQTASLTWLKSRNYTSSRSFLVFFTKTAKTAYQLHHVCPFVCPQEITRLPLDVFS
jgi:hypothetical protein